MRRVLPLLIILLFSARAAAALSFTENGGGAPVNFTADTLNVSADSVVAEGKVSVEWSGRSLKAQKVSYQRKGGRIEAEGAVILTDGQGNRIKCDSIDMNADTLEGTIAGAELYLAESGYTVTAKKLERTGPATYKAKDASFTACEKTWPSWTIDADWMEVEIEGYLTGGGGVFRVERVPSLYLPYFFYPVKLKRQSGFLPPRLGYSDSRGFELKVPYYLAFADNADITFTTNYQEKIGLSETADLRYILAENHEGEVKVKFLKSFGESDGEAEIVADHYSRFGDATTLDILADYVTDKNKYKELGDTLEERSTLLKESYVYLNHATAAGSLFGLGRWTESFDTPQDETLQQLPSMGLWGKQYGIYGPLSGISDAILDNFEREVGARGQRLRRGQGFSISHGSGLVGVSASGGMKVNKYYLSDGEYEESAPWAQAGISLRSLGGAGALDVALEPSLEWSFRGEGEDAAAPYFDINDDFSKKSELSPSLEALFIWDGADFLHLHARKPLNLRSIEGKTPEKGDWLPLAGDIALWPVEKMEIYADGEYDDGGGAGWLRWAAGLEWSGEKENELFVRRSYVKGESDYLDAGFGYGLTERVSLYYRNRFSIEAERSIEATYGLTLRHPCWQLRAAFSRVYLPQDESYDNRTYVTVTLAGLDKLGKFSW